MNPFNILSISIFFLLTLLSQSQKYNCVPEFSLKGDWQGADSAYSIPLPDGRVVWTFGDTMYGDQRHNGKMTHSSLGISTCEDGVWNITYYLQKDNDGNVRSFFKVPGTEEEGKWSWALDGVYYNGSLWITLILCESDNSTGYFKNIGASLAKVTNLDADPLKWNITYLPLVDDGILAYPSASTFIEGDYLYIYTLYDNADKGMILPRIPLSKLDDPKSNMEYLAQDGTWKQGFVPSDAKVVMDKGVSEMSVRYHPEFKQWVVVQVTNAFFGNEAWIRFAPDFNGPWSEPTVIYKFPEMEKYPNQNVFCYAVKEHPQYEVESQQLLFTYVCNSWSPEDLEHNYHIYFPISVSLAKMLPVRVLSEESI